MEASNQSGITDVFNCPRIRLWLLYLLRHVACIESMTASFLQHTIQWYVFPQESLLFCTTYAINVIF